MQGTHISNISPHTLSAKTTVFFSHLGCICCHAKQCEIARRHVCERRHARLKRGTGVFDPVDLPSSDIVEHGISILGCAGLVEDVERLQSFELLFLMDLVPTNMNLLSYVNSLLKGISLCMVLATKYNNRRTEYQLA